jgi:hypothetical protein
MKQRHGEMMLKFRGTRSKESYRWRRTIGGEEVE